MKPYKSIYSTQIIEDLLDIEFTTKEDFDDNNKMYKKSFYRKHNDVKIDRNYLSKLLRCSTSARLIFEFFVDQLTQTNNCFMIIPEEIYTRLNITQSTFSKAKKELLENNLIAHVPHEYYNNIYCINFNVAHVGNIDITIRKYQEQQKELKELENQINRNVDKDYGYKSYIKRKEKQEYKDLCKKQKEEMQKFYQAVRRKKTKKSDEDNE